MVFFRKIKYLQGGVQFPTGGKVRERIALIRCNSETDSTVWMEEGTHENAFIFTPWVDSTRGYFLWEEAIWNFGFSFRRT